MNQLSRGEYQISLSSLMALFFVFVSAAHPGPVHAVSGFQGVAYERKADGSIGPTIAGVAIKFVSENGQVTKTATTNSTGFYRVDLDVARYGVTAAHPDYESYSSAPGFFVVTAGSYQTGNIFLKKAASTSAGLKITGGAQLIGHTDLINSVAFSPDGRLLASGSMDRTVKLWDVQTNACLRTLTLHTSWVRSVAFSPDGKLLASASDDKTVRLWDPQTGAPVRVLSGHYSGVLAVAFSPDGRTLVSLSPVNRGELIVWDVQSGALVKRIAVNHTSMVRTLAFSPDGKTVVTAGGSPNGPGENKVWDIQTGTSSKTLTDTAGFDEAVAFSPDAALLAGAGGIYDNALTVWDAKTYQAPPVMVLPQVDPSGTKNGLKSVAFSGDGKLVGVGGAVVRLYERATWKSALYLYPEHGVTHTLAFCPTRLMVATAGAKKLPLDKYAIQLWVLSSGDAPPPPPPGLTLVSKHFFGGMGDQAGTGISALGGAVYLSGYDNAAYNGQSMAVAFANPPAANPLWSARWPNQSGSPRPGMENFSGVSASDAGAFFAGMSWTQTTDRVGDKESKSVLVKFPLNGPTGREVGGADWVAKPAFFPNYWGWESLNASLVSKEGNSTFIYVTGAAQTNGANNTAVLAKYDAAGKHVWRLDLGDHGPYKNSRGYSLAIANGRVYIGGMSHYPYTDPATVRAGLWTCDFSGGGKLAYGLSRSMGSERPVAVAASGSSVYLAMGIDNGPNGGVDAVVQKYDFSKTNYLGWNKTYGGPGDDIPYGLAADDKRVYGVGETKDNLTQGRASVLVEIDAADGTRLTTTRYDGDRDDVARGVAVAESDIYVVGESRSSGGAAGNASGQSDLMLLRYKAGAAPPKILPPVADAGPDQTVECDSYIGTRVQLDGSMSRDPQGRTLTYAWKWPLGSATGVRPSVRLPMGRHVIVLTVNNGALSAADSVVILIRDSTPPVFRRLSVNPSELWPPNNKPVLVRADAIDVFDSCTPRPRIALVSIKPGPPHPGAKGPYVSEALYGTDDRAFKLLAAKNTTGDSRTYTIVYRATDNARNSSYDTALVVVPHSKGKSDKPDAGGSVGGGSKKK